MDLASFGISEIVLPAKRVGVLWHGYEGDANEGIHRLVKLDNPQDPMTLVYLGLSPLVADFCRQANLWCEFIPADKPDLFFAYLTHLVVFDLTGDYQPPAEWVARNKPTQIFRRKNG